MQENQSSLMGPGLFLDSTKLCICEWVYSLIIWFWAIDWCFSRAVLGVQDLPFWAPWYQFFMVSVLGRYLVYLLQYIYGCYRRRGLFSVAIDGAAFVCAIIATLSTYRITAVSWVLRCHIGLNWLSGMLIASWLVMLTLRDLDAYVTWRKEAAGTEELDLDWLNLADFREYVKTVNTPPDTAQK